MPIELAYFNFKEKCGFSQFQEYLEIFKNELKRLEITLPDIELVDGKSNYQQINELLHKRWRKNVESQWAKIINEIIISLNP